MSSRKTEAMAQGLAQAIANQAEALANGTIPEGQRYSQVLKIEANVNTLKAWTKDDRTHTR